MTGVQSETAGAAPLRWSENGVDTLTAVFSLWSWIGFLVVVCNHRIASFSFRKTEWGVNTLKLEETFPRDLVLVHKQCVGTVCARVKFIPFGPQTLKRGLC